MENDNNKIAFNIRRMIYFINKYFLKQKKILFNELIYQLTKKGNNHRKKFYNIYDELFNEYKKKEKKIYELEYKFNKSEEKLCTFSPRINTGIIKFKKKILKKEIINKSHEIKIKNPFCGNLYGVNNYDASKYETIDNHINKNIIFNFVNKSRINNIENNNLYNIKYMSNKNINKNSFLSSTSRNTENIKYNTIENNKCNKSNIKRNIIYSDKNNALFKEITNDKNNKKNKTYHLNKKEKNNNINDNTIMKNYMQYLEKDIFKNKYNTINFTENKDINLFNKNKFKDKINGKNINEEIKYNNLLNFNCNKTNIIYNASNKDSTQNEESKQKEYFYSFKKEKLPYNYSFNDSSKKKLNNIISGNDSKTSIKSNQNKNKKYKIPTSLRDNSKFQNFNIINKMNKIYSNNYHNKINSIKKSEQDFNTNNNSSFSNRNYKISKNKLSLLDLTSKKESTRHQSNTNINTNYNTKGNRSNKELSYNNSTNKKEENKQYEIVNECNMNLEKRKGYKNNKSEKSMTLQSLSDSKMLELAEHYINNGEDSFEVLDLKYLEFKKNIKKEKETRDITFG